MKRLFLSIRNTKVYLSLIAVMLIMTLTFSMAYFVDRVSHEMTFTTATFTKDGYTLTRTAPTGPFVAGEDVVATIFETNSKTADMTSTISMTAEWISPDPDSKLFDNDAAADNATLTVSGDGITGTVVIDYTVTADNKIAFDIPAHILSAGTTNNEISLSLHIPESLVSTGEIQFTFENVELAEEPDGFTTAFDPDASLDYDVRVGWAASSYPEQNGKALMGYLVEGDTEGEYGIEFEFAFGYTTSPMKDFASETDAKWSYYSDSVTELTFVEGMTTIGDYAFADFEKITSLDLPESLQAVGAYAFDNISIESLTIPANVVTFEEMSFGHINELTEIIFETAEGVEISFPEAGSSTGAFYVDPYVPTKILGLNEDAQSYDWITDQRRVTPVIRAYSYNWDNSIALMGGYVAPEVDFHTAALLPTIQNVIFADANTYYAEDNYAAISAMKSGATDTYTSGTVTYWNVTDPDTVTANPNAAYSVIASLDSDTGLLTIMCDGYKTMANKESDFLFALMENVETIDARKYDTSTTESLYCWHWFNDPEGPSSDPDIQMPSVGATTILGTDTWDTSNVIYFDDMFHNAENLTNIDVSNWDTSSAQYMNGMFKGCMYLTSDMIDVSGWNVENVKSIEAMFARASGFTTSIGLENWYMPNLVNMEMAFSSTNFESLDLNKWMPEKLENMYQTFMFSSVKSIDMSAWTTPSLSVLYGTFDGTSNLTTLDLSNWDTSKVVTMYHTFRGSGIQTIDLTGWDFTSCTNVGGMFEGAASLTNITGEEGWTNMGTIERIYYMFDGCESLETLSLADWDVSGVTGSYFAFQYMFRNCKNLDGIDVSDWVVSSAENFTYMFYNCESLSSIDISKWDMVNATSSSDIRDMFNGCRSLTELTFPEAINFIAFRMAANCPKLEKITFLSTAESMGTIVNPGSSAGAFYVDPDDALERYPDIGKIPTEFIFHGEGMALLLDGRYDFDADNRILPKVLVSIAVTTPPDKTEYIVGEDFEKPGMVVTATYSDGSTRVLGDDEYTILDGTDLPLDQTEITVSYTEGEVTATATTPITVIKAETAFAIYSADDQSLTFYKNSDYSSITTGSTYNGKTVTAKYDRLETSNWGTSSVPWSTYRSSVLSVIFVDEIIPKSTRGWFYQFSACTSMDLAKLNTTNVTDMSSMFLSCKALTTLDLSSFDTSSVTDMGSMFQNCSGLTTLDLSNFDTRSVTYMGSMFQNCSGLTTLDLSSFDTSSVTSMSYMFKSCTGLTTLDLSSFDTSSVTYMRDMFRNCSSLTTLDLSSFDTSSVTDMGNMFQNCSGLTTLDLSSFDTSSVTYMRDMFNDCKALTTLDLSNFNTSKVTNMSWMFQGCSKLTTLDLSSFDTSSVTTMYAMFAGCKALTTLDLSNFDTSSVTDMNSMFMNCSGLTTLDLSNFDTSSVTDMNSMFVNCSGLTTLDMSSFDTSSVTNMSYMFNGMNKLETVTLGSKFAFVGDTGYLPTPNSSYITGADGMWYSVSTGTGYAPADVPNNTADTYVAVIKEKTAFAIYSADDNSLTFYKNSDYDLIATGSTYNGKTVTAIYTGFETASYASHSTVPWYSYISNILSVSFADEISPQSTAYWFYNARNCSSMDLEKLNTSSATNMSNMFNGCHGLTTLDVSNFDTSSVTDMSYMFSNCSKLTTLDVSSFDTSSVTDMSYMFQSGILTTLDLSNWDTSNVTNMSNMFSGCSGLTTLDVTNFDTSSVTDMSSMFNSCSKLTTLDVSSFVTSSVTNMYGMFSSCKALTTLDVTKFDTSSVTDMRRMFYGCSGLTTLDVTKFDTSSVTVMSSMFQSCGGLTTLDLSSFDTSNVTNMSSMFYGCSGLTTLDVTKFDTSSVTNMSYMFRSCKALTTLDVSTWDTSSVTTMYYMFCDCSGLTTLDVTKFDTSSVTDMSYMFMNCSGLTTLDVSRLNTSSVTNMGSMFSGCSSLTTLDVSNFDTSSVTKTSFMFKDCSQLKTIYSCDDWSTGKVTSSTSMFKGCTNLSGAIAFNSNKLTVSYANCTTGYFTAPGRPVLTVRTPESTSSATPTYTYDVMYTISGTVEAASGIKSLTVNGIEVAVNADGSWDTDIALVANVTTEIVIIAVDNENNTTSLTRYVHYVAPTAFAIYSADDNSLTFYKNYDYSSIKVGGTYNGKDVGNIYTGFESTSYNAGRAPWYLCGEDVLSVIFVDEISPISTANWFFHFAACTSMDLAKLNTSNVTDMQSMFDGCSSLTTLDLSSFDTSSVTDMNNMFSGCSSLSQLKLNNWDTGNVTNMRNMFSGCIGFTTLDLSNFDTSNVTSMNCMFLNCSGLTTLDLSSFDTGNVTDMQCMFQDCTALTTLDVSTWDTSSVTTTTQMFLNCSGLTTLDVNNWNTSSVTGMGSMFNGCSGLTTLDLSNWDTSSVAYMYNMFLECTGLTTLDLSNWDTSKVTNMSMMFYKCNGLTTLDLSSFDTSSVTDMGSMFQNCNSLTTICVSERWSTVNVTSSWNMFYDCHNLSGAISYDASMHNATYANYTTGYLTYKAAP